MILIGGGAGYIGSHTNKLLSQSGYQTIVVDNLIYGHEHFVKWGKFVRGDINDVDNLRQIFSQNKIKAVMHFAAFAYVGESTIDPQKYYINNVSGTLNLLKIMREFDCKNFIFSSSCATYGNPEYSPIDEEHVQKPINPYGRTKLYIEEILKDYSNSYDFKFVNLRYFNAAGADFDIELGEHHDPETHLIPLVLDAALGLKDDIKVFGTDYPTKDGSAIRDYIHVNDLANAHKLALEFLINGGESCSLNLANGEGYSVIEIIEMVKKITGKDFNVTYSTRRPGDPPKLIGNAKKALDVLGWKPKYKLEEIIDSAWNWHKKNFFEKKAS